MAFEIGQDSGEVRRVDDGVEVVVEDGPRVDFQALVLAAIFEGFDENIAAGRGGEERDPRDDGGRDEVGGVGLVSAIATAHGRVLARPVGVARAYLCFGGAPHGGRHEVQLRPTPTLPSATW